MNYLATLVYGQRFYYAQKQFLKGKPIKVTEKEKQHLETSAILKDRVGRGDNVERVTRQRFTFTPIATESTPGVRPPATESPEETPTEASTKKTAVKRKAAPRKRQTKSNE